MAKQSRLAHLSNDELSAMTTKEIADIYYDGNVGAAWNALNSRGLKGAPSANDGEKKPSTQRQKKVETYLPGRVSDWCLRKLGSDPDDGDMLPEGFGPENFLALPDVSGETTNYLRLISRLDPEKELSPLKAWLGCGLTIAEREQVKIEAIKDALTKALDIATFNPELALAIAALMNRFGFQTETETE